MTGLDLVYLLTLQQHVVALVDVERGDGDRPRGHLDGEVEVVRAAERCERGQGLKGDDCVLRDGKKSHETSADSFTCGAAAKTRQRK